MKKKGLLLILVALICLLFVTPVNKQVNAEGETVTLTFDDKVKRTSYSASAQVWEENGIIFTNNKSNSTNNVADYAAPVRVYANSEIIVEYPGMTQIVFDCNNNSYAKDLGGVITGSTISNDKVTVVFENPQDRYTVKVGAQVRIDSLTITFDASAQDDPVLKQLKSDVRYYNNSGIYTRNTAIYADLADIMADMDNIENYFHNPGDYVQDANRFSNVYLDRTTKFVDDYLYFVETEVGFGTSEEGTLVSFKGTSFNKSKHEQNAIDNAFVTLKDFVELNAISNEVNADLTGGWTVDADGVYTSSDENVIAAAMAFTAPGWVSPDTNYIDFTKVTIGINSNGHLEITLWASSTNIGLLDVEKLADDELDYTNKVADLVFSRATIEDPNTTVIDEACAEIADLGDTIVQNYPLPNTLEKYPTLTIVWSGEGVEYDEELKQYVLKYTASDVDTKVYLNATVTLGHQVREVNDITFTHKAGVAGLEAKTYSYSFTNKVFTENDSTNDLNGVSWTMNGTGKGTPQNHDSSKGQQFGSKSNPYTTLTFTSESFTKVTKIVIETSGASGVNATVSITVGGVEVGTAQKLTTSSTKYTFETETPLDGPIVITYTISARAIYIKTITVDYSVAK